MTWPDLSAIQGAVDATAEYPNGPLVVGCSGGADSVALVAALAACDRWPVVVAHVDHGLRDESAADAAWVSAQVAAWASGCRQPWHYAPLQVDIAARARRARLGHEEAGRTARLAWFTWLARRHQAAAVVTAHHHDDQAETIIANILRGCGPQGLAGIPQVRALADGLPLVRPWLGVTRQVLRAALAQHGQAWREDHSNRDCRYHRNRIRHQILPSFEVGCPGVAAALCEQAQRLASARVAPPESWLESLDPQHGGRVSLRAVPVAADARLAWWRALAVWLQWPLHRAHLHALDDLAQGADGRACDRRAWRVRRAGSALVIEPRERATAPTPQVVCDDGRTPLGNGGWLQVTPLATAAPGSAEPGGDAVYLAASAVRGELTWRAAQPGERWQPLGADGTRSLFRWLATHGVSRPQRPQWPVLADHDGPLWVYQRAIAERARPQPGEPVMRVELLRAMPSGHHPPA